MIEVLGFAGVIMYAAAGLAALLLLAVLALRARTRRHEPESSSTVRDELVLVAPHPHPGGFLGWDCGPDLDDDEVA